MHTTKLLLHRHHLPKPSNVTMKCQDIANTQSQTSMEKDSKDWMNEFNLNLMVRGKSSRSGIKVKKKEEWRISNDLLAKSEIYHHFAQNNTSKQK